jgi:hypothetical protein
VRGLSVCIMMKDAERSTMASRLAVDRRRG